MPRGTPHGAIGPHEDTRARARDLLDRARQAGIRQPAEWLAVEIGISVATLYRYASGHSEMGVDTAARGDRAIYMAETRVALGRQPEEPRLPNPGKVTDHGWAG